MTTTLALNDSNDLHIGSDGNLAILTALPAVEQCCATASKAQLTEMVLSIELGIPNFEAVWVGSPNLPLWQSYLTTTLNSVLGVNSVTSITLSAQNNILSYTATISSQYGTAEISESITTP